MNQRNHPDELISASLTGELGLDERGTLDAHLADCERCRALRTDLIEQRRLLGGMRREQAPASLNPRIRQAIASGASGNAPWWRRRSLLTGGAAAVAVLVLGVGAGLAIQGGGIDGDFVGGPASATPVVASASPTPEASRTGAPVPTATLASTPVATASPPPATPSPAPAVTEPPSPAATSPLDPGSVAFLDYVPGPAMAEVFRLEEPTLDENGYPDDLNAATPITRPSEWSGPATYAEISPDGEWLAYQTERGQSGMTDVWVVRLSDGVAISLGETIADTPFLRRMTWSHDGHQLAYTLAPPENPGTQDVWMFDTATNEVFQLVATGDSYAASWQDADRLWISRAGERPVSYRLTLSGAGAPTGPNTDPAASASQTVDGAFQPLFSPDGSHAIFWRGTMTQRDGETWRLSEGGMPYLVDIDPEAEVANWDAAQKLFPDLPADRDAFSFASITWSYNSDDYAVWNTVWTGTPVTDQTDRGEFPDSTLIYLGNVSGNTLIRDYPYLDLVSQREDGAVVRDVEFAPGAPGGISAVWTTLQLPVGGDMDGPTAVLEVTPAGPSGYEPAEAQPGVWRGPAVYLAEPGD